MKAANRPADKGVPGEVQHGGTVNNMVITMWGASWVAEVSGDGLWWNCLVAVLFT